MQLGHLKEQNAICDLSFSVHCSFSDARDQFMKSKIMVSHKIVPGVLTWPTTTIVIEETRTEKLQVRKNAILQTIISRRSLVPFCSIYLFHHGSLSGTKLRKWRMLYIWSVEAFVSWYLERCTQCLQISVHVFCAYFSRQK